MSEAAAPLVAAARWFPEKDADKFNDAELKACPIYKTVMESPAAEWFGDNESMLLSFVKRKISDLRKNASTLRIKPSVLALFEALTKEGIPFTSEKGVRIFPDGRIKAPSGQPRAASIDFVSLIGKTLTTKVGEKAPREECRGPYKLVIGPSLKSREDIKFSLRLKQPNDAPDITYPAADPKNIGEHESNSLTGVMEKSLMKQPYAFASFFRKALKELLPKEEKETSKTGAKVSASAAEEHDDATDEDDDDDDEEEGPDLADLLDES